MKIDILEVAVGHLDQRPGHALVHDKEVTDHPVALKNHIQENVLDPNLTVDHIILETDQSPDQEDPVVNDHITKIHHIKVDPDTEEVHLNIKNHVHQAVRQ